MDIKIDETLVSVDADDRGSAKRGRLHKTSKIQKSDVPLATTAKAANWLMYGGT